MWNRRGKGIFPYIWLRNNNCMNMSDSRVKSTVFGRSWRLKSTDIHIVFRLHFIYVVFIAYKWRSENHFIWDFDWLWWRTFSWLSLWQTRLWHQVNENDYYQIAWLHKCRSNLIEHQNRRHLITINGNRTFKHTNSKGTTTNNHIG